MRYSAQAIILFMITLFSLTGFTGVRAKEYTPSQISREQAVTQARQGKYQKALATLSRLHREHPGEHRILYDYLVVSTWAERYADVPALVATLRPEQVPAYVARSAAAALRKSGRLTRAQHWYDVAARRFSDDADIAVGRALTLADRGRADRGLDALNAFKREHPKSDAGFMSKAMAYISGKLEPPKPFALPPRPVNAYAAEQDEAVIAARRGKLTEALTRLGVLNRRYPDDQFLLGDYLTVLQWNKENKRVVDLSGQLMLDRAPAYAIESSARALLALRNPHDAESFLEAALTAQQRNPELLISAASLVGKSGDPYKAAKYLDEARSGQNSELKARIRAAKKANGYERIKALDRLNNAEAILARTPDNQDALKNKIRALSIVRGCREARSTLGDLLSAGHASALPPEQVHDIYRDASLKSAYWGEQSGIPLYPQERERHLTASLASLEALTASPLCAASTQCLIRARSARIQPLYYLGRYQEAALEYAYVRDKIRPLSAATQLAAAGAYMGMRKPRLAAKIYKDVSEYQNEYDPPLNADYIFTAEAGVFWSALEDERLSDALGQAQKIYARAVHHGDGQPPFEDTDWKKGASASILGYAYLYTGNLDKAERYFETLAHNAPAMLNAQSGLADAYAMRGLPRAALDTLERGLIFSPGDVTMSAKRAEALMDMQDWRKARELLNELEPYSPYSQEVRQLHRRWETHSLFELHVDGSWAKIFAAKNPGTDHRAKTPSLEGRLYSPPIAYDWRVYAGFAMARDNFSEGRARQNLALGGLEYRGKELTARFEARNDHVKTDRLGLGLYGLVTPDDHWSFPFEVEKDSRKTPLRALNADITADSVLLGASYRWNESRKMDVFIEGMSFSDGNQRFSLSGIFTQRLGVWQTHYLDGAVAAYASGNSKDGDRPYFNPKSDLEIDATLTYGALLWRDYDKSLSHAVSVGAGGYAQLNNDVQPVWNVAYSQSLDLTDRFSLTCGVDVNRIAYDGHSEHSVNNFLSMVWKF